MSSTDLVTRIRAEIAAITEAGFGTGDLEDLHPELRVVVDGVLHLTRLLGEAATALEADRVISQEDITRISDDERADELGVDRLARAMKAKLGRKRSEGYRGWNNDCTLEHLEELLKKHLAKPWTPAHLVDVANLVMMLFNRQLPTRGGLVVQG